MYIDVPVPEEDLPKLKGINSKEGLLNGSLRAVR
jgi:hypothetical protein